MKTSELVSIVSGINQKRHPLGEVFYLQSRDFLNSNLLDPELKPSLEYTERLEKHFLQKGDVLVMSKGHNGFNAFTYSGSKKPAVASSIFLVLKNLNPIVLSAYLAWYINLESTQKELINKSRGTALPAIKRSMLAEVQIPIVSINEQQKILKIDQYKKKESELVKRLDELKIIELEIKLKNYIKK